MNYLEDQMIYSTMLDDSKAIERLLELDYELYSTASAATDIAYLFGRDLREAKKITTSAFNGMSNNQISQIVRAKMLNVSSIVGFLTVSEIDINLALTSDWKDFEDALQYVVSLRHGMDAVITWNVKDFKKAEIPVYTPREFITQF